MAMQSGMRLDSSSAPPERPAGCYTSESSCLNRESGRPAMTDASEQTADLETWQDAVQAEARQSPAPPGAAPDLPHSRLQRLVYTLEAQVIPRMVRARSPTTAIPCSSPSTCPGDCGRCVGGLVELLLAGDAHSTREYLDGVQAQGVGLEALYLDVLAPAARHLGELWDDDRCDFTEVTLGVGQLQLALRERSMPPRDEPADCLHRRRVLLAPAVGEQHTFGLLMVAEFFRLAAWDVWGGPLASRGELHSLVHREWFDVVGLSLSCDRTVENASADIEAIRAASLNPEVGIMVGGPEVMAHPELMHAVHADATATDGRRAPLEASRLLARSAGRN